MKHSTINFDGSRINWVIRDSNGIIMVVRSIHLGNTLIIMIECIALKDDIPTATYNGF